MKLKNESIVKMREEVEKRMEMVPDGTRIKLPKDLLEQLLFDDYVYNKAENRVLKLPVWSGQFLQKIDLSEIDFENVSWSLHSFNNPSFLYIGEQHPVPSGVDEEFLATMLDCALENQNESIGKVLMYGGTNAKIDLTKSFEAKELNQIHIAYCDFRGVDLSSNSGDLSYLDWFKVHCSNISDTGLAITALPKRISCVESDFSNIDLSSLEIEAVDVIDARLVYFTDCNLTNTGIKLVYTDEKYAEYCDSYCRFYNCEQVYPTETLEYYIDNKWKGCYVNGKLNSSAMFDDASDYLRFEADEFERIFSSIDKQISGDAGTSKK